MQFTALGGTNRGSPLVLAAGRIWRKCFCSLIKMDSQSIYSIYIWMNMIWDVDLNSFVMMQILLNFCEATFLFCVILIFYLLERSLHGYVWVYWMSFLKQHIPSIIGSYCIGLAFWLFIREVRDCKDNVPWIQTKVLIFLRSCYCIN